MFWKQTDLFWHYKRPRGYRWGEWWRPLFWEETCLTWVPLSVFNSFINAWFGLSDNPERRSRNRIRYVVWSQNMSHRNKHRRQWWGEDPLTGGNLSQDPPAWWRGAKQADKVVHYHYPHGKCGNGSVPLWQTPDQLHHPRARDVKTWRQRERSCFSMFRDVAWWGIGHRGSRKPSLLCFNLPQVVILDTIGWCGLSRMQLRQNVVPHVSSV